MTTALVVAAGVAFAYGVYYCFLRFSRGGNPMQRYDRWNTLVSGVVAFFLWPYGVALIGVGPVEALAAIPLAFAFWLLVAVVVVHFDKRKARVR